MPRTKVCKAETTKKAHPPDSKNVNVLQKSIKQVEEAWVTYYKAAINVFSLRTFAEEQERKDVMTPLVQESMDHEDWLVGIEDVLTALEQAGNPLSKLGSNLLKSC